MKVLKSANDKIQEICDVIKAESLKPAKEEAERLIKTAEAEARRIKQEAEAEADKALREARETIEQERNVFESSLKQAARQATEALKQTITRDLFNPEMASLVEKGSSSVDVVGKLIDAIVGALQKEGLEANLAAYIPASLNPQDVNRTVTQAVLKKLEGNSVALGEFKGGARVKVQGKNLTIDISDPALKELFAAYLKKPEFRELIFNAKG